MSAQRLASALDALEERNALRKLEPWIQALARRYFGDTHLADDAEQIARIAAVKAIRAWDAEQVSRASFVKHAARYAVIDFLRKEASGRSFTEQADEESADAKALDAERALLVLEIYNALPAAQQAEVDELLENGRGRGGDHGTKLLRVVRKIVKALEAA
jgi:DNA-directed RNA polymerase specialized sigma24 family protein